MVLLSWHHPGGFPSRGPFLARTRGEETPSRDQVVRRALELYMDEAGDHSKKMLAEAGIYVPGQINGLSNVKGFSPAQWVLGKSVANNFSLTGEVFNPAAPDDDEVGSFVAVQQRRLRAQMAFLKADTDLKLRKATNKNYREYGHPPVQLGQRGYYF